MKLYITNSTDELSSHFTYSPIRGNDIRKLDDELIGDSECTEILAPNIIDYIPLNCLYQTIENYIKKLRKKGEIILGGTDVYMLGRDIVAKTKHPSEINQAIFGGPNSWELKCGLVGITDLVGLLEGFGLNITHKSLNKLNYLVKAVKN